MTKNVPNVAKVFKTFDILYGSSDFRECLKNNCNIETIFDDIDKDIIFIYGNHEIRLDNNSSKVYPKPLDQFWKGMPTLLIPHL